MSESDPRGSSAGTGSGIRHPTKQAILDAAMADMEATGEASLRISKILEESGASNGSLYHHFGSREELVREAIAMRFLGPVFQGLEVFSDRVAGVRTTDDLLALIDDELRRISTAELMEQRIRRISALGAALPRKELIARVSADQVRYFDYAAEALRGLQERGVINADLDPRAFAAWFLGLTLSRILTDIDPHLDADGEWSAFTYKAVVAILTP